MSAYDRWLEAPYVDAARHEAAYERWVEDNDLDFDQDHWEEFEAWAEAQMEDHIEELAERWHGD